MVVKFFWRDKLYSWIVSIATGVRFKFFKFFSHYTKSYERICIKFSGKAENEPVKLLLDFGSDLHHIWAVSIATGEQGRRQLTESGVDYV